jgi:ABC-type uncharacterized transport system fused permease/ATPase subunit
MGAAARRIELRRLIEMLSRNLHEGPALSGRSTSVGYNVPVLQFPLLLAPTFAVGAISFAALAQTSNLLAQISRSLAWVDQWRVRLREHVAALFFSLYLDNE